MKRKKYNPFKMWGSWVGAIIPLILFYIIELIVCGTSCDLIISNALMNIKLFPLYYALGSGYLTLILNIILGFLIGWGLEVFFRKNKWFGLR